MRILAATTALTAALLLAAAPGRADTIVVTYGIPGQQNANAVIVSNANVLGVETFNSLPLGSTPFVTDYGTGGVITGSYSGLPHIVPADQFGGAGGTGQYVDAFRGEGGYSIALATSGIPGVNYFGYWLSALDAGNELQLLRGGVVISSYHPADLIAALGACPTAYCGNPNPPFLGQDGGEPFAFVNFVDLTGYFDEIRIFEAAGFGGNYESDNHTVAYCRDAAACVSGHTLVPEPVSMAILGMGLLGLGAIRRRG